ncbi:MULTISPECIES: Ger(x)C family spore germination protein [unclassified Sporosarcina]|uniref:Ger(x)C family spore germination protein n=1 Tax=unclassified Sporosarcina TaxID=2647733 RepID=UPI000C169433|nr:MULTISPECIES: Ger(x)C family spore germination protein [unclassified Sporosarcina]PID06405.1 spore gernimation protein GerC [Sporosarcina sp. P30]PID09599.1 spore gernimation protein GerC [Sporosarcina sp. P31]PID13176.1 spore gernimation protein GerC [Sporosarcina sp. P32b]
MKKCIVTLLVLTLFLSGCWDRRELNELGIAMAIGIDKTENEYVISAQVVVPSEVSMKASTGRSAVTLYTATGETVYEAIRKMTKNAPRKMYPGHLQILVINEDLAKEGIAESLELLSRDWELRSDFYVVVAKDITATEVLNVTTPIENIPANKMFNSLKTSEKNWAGTEGVILDELVTNLISDGKEAVLTGIQVLGNKETGTSKQNVESITPSTRIEYDNLAVFKEDQLVGWLNEEESRGYSDITNTVKKTVTSITCPKEGKIIIDIFRYHSKIIGSINKGEPEVDIKIEAEGNIGEVLCSIDIMEPETIDKLEKIYEEEVKEIIHQTIESVQKQYQSDIFGFGEAIHRSNPKEWNEMKEHWDEKFSDLTVNVHIDMKIRRIGTVNNSFLKKIKD